MRTSSAGSALDIGTTGAGAGTGAVAGAVAGGGAGDPRHSIETQVFITSLCQRPPGQPLESEF